MRTTRRSLLALAAVAAITTAGFSINNSSTAAPAPPARQCAWWNWRCRVSTTTTTTRPTTTTAPTATTTVPPTTAPSSTTTVTTAAPGTAFSEDFSSQAALDRFDWQLHTTVEGIEPMYMGEHDEACHGPDTTRMVMEPQVALDFVDARNSQYLWWCAPSGAASGHVMTAINTLGLATLSFSPKQTFTDVHKVCWDQNMNNLGEGKWVNVFVVPASDVASHGGNLAYKAGSAAGTTGIDQQLPANAFSFTWLRGTGLAYMATAGGGFNEVLNAWGSYDANMEPTPAPRHPICVEDLENGTLRYSIFETDGQSVHTFTSPGSFPNGVVKVIWEDANYNPDKHAGTGHLTWHWDDISVS